MSYLVAISCAGQERQHAEMLKAFLVEELGESLAGSDPQSPEATIYFYIHDPRQPGSEIPELEAIYRDCAVMVAIIGDQYGERPLPAWEGQMLPERAKAGTALVALIEGVAWPSSLDVALRPQFPAPYRLPKSPLNAQGFSRVRDFARQILDLLQNAGKKPQHPRERRGTINAGGPAIRRHLHGLEYVFNGANQQIGKEADEAVRSSAVLLGRLEQAQRAANVAAALVDLGAMAANEGKADSSFNPGSDVYGTGSAKLHGVATRLVSVLATTAEKRDMLQTFSLGLRVRLLLRLEHYLLKHTVDDVKLDAVDATLDTTPLNLLTEPLQDILLPNAGKDSIRLGSQACPVLQEKAPRVAETLSRWHWRCAGRLSQVAAPRGLPELQRFREESEIRLQAKPRNL